ncbi:MAG: peptide deformylase [Anaerolineae bacterium]
MTVRKILTIGRHEKLLRTKSEPVRKFGKDVKELAQDIRDTIAANPAIGLAAVQIGVLKRVFGARMGYYEEQPDEEMQPPVIFVNPEIVSQSEAVERDSDGCLSIPGMMGYTERSSEIRLRWQDEHGQRHEQDFKGWDARVILHEFDHLNGVLFLDRLASMDDLYISVLGEDGKRRMVKYNEAMKRAEAAALEASKPNLKDK